MKEARFVCAAILNIADDHLDWHGNFEKYAAAKAKVYERTRLACVYNIRDQKTEAAVENAEVVEGARAIGFGLGIPSRSQIGYVEDLLCDRAFLDERADSALEIARFEDIGEISVLTPHLLANVAAATALARSVGVAPAQIRRAIRNFKLDSHRIELVTEANGISWFDDSKATNPHAAAASLEAFESVIWVVGGLLKGVDLTDLIEHSKKKIKLALVIGVDREPVVEALRNAGVNYLEITTDDNSQLMQLVAKQAVANATSGDTVLLAPAAASMDQFKDYAERGDQFAAAVRAALGLENRG
jgi:UDP-N-acetylmuramoylalanine--D-glutamate ligase